MADKIEMKKKVEHKVRCTMCEDKKDASEIVGSHFAAKFCSACWPEYKSHNGRKCYICYRPMWQCTC